MRSDVPHEGYRVNRRYFRRGRAAGPCRPFSRMQQRAAGIMSAVPVQGGAEATSAHGDESAQARWQRARAHLPARAEGVEDAARRVVGIAGSGEVVSLHAREARQCRQKMPETPKLLLQRKAFCPPKRAAWEKAGSERLGVSHRDPSAPALFTALHRASSAQPPAPVPSLESSPEPGRRRLRVREDIAASPRK